MDRIHRAGLGAGRYDTTGRHRLAAPPGSPRHGVCCVALKPVGAFVEALGRIGALSAAEIDTRPISEAGAARDPRLAYGVLTMC